jgi:hypothetical protein
MLFPPKKEHYAETSALAKARHPGPEKSTDRRLVTYPLIKKRLMPESISSYHRVFFLTSYAISLVK